MRRVKLFLRRLLPGQDHDQDEHDLPDTEACSIRDHQSGLERVSGEAVDADTSSPAGHMAMDNRCQWSDGTPASLRGSSSSRASDRPVTKLDFGQTVHPKREDRRLASSLPSKPSKPAVDRKFVVVQPLRMTLAGIQEVVIPPATEQNVHTRGVLRPGPLIYEEYCEIEKRRQKATNPLFHLNHNMQTQTSFEADYRPLSEELVERESCSSSLADSQTPAPQTDAREVPVPPIGRGGETESTVSSFDAAETGGDSGAHLEVKEGREQLVVSRAGSSHQGECPERKQSVIQSGAKSLSEINDDQSCPETVLKRPSKLSRVRLSRSSQPRPGASATVLLHSTACSKDCQALAIPQLCDKRINFTVERGVHDEEEGLLIATATSGSQDGGAGPAKESNLNFLTVKFDTKALQTIDLNVMSCVSGSNIPHDLCLTDSMGFPMPEAKLKVIPYPCPCHPLDQLIKGKHSDRMREDQDAVSAPGRNTDTNQDDSAESTELKATDWASNTTNDQFLNTSYDFNFDYSASHSGNEKSGAKSCENSTEGKPQPVGDSPHSPDLISVRSLAAIAGQGVFRTVKESPLQAVSVALPVRNTFLSYVPSEFERQNSTGTSASKTEHSGEEILFHNDVHEREVADKETSSSTAAGITSENRIKRFLLQAAHFTEVYSPAEFTDSPPQNISNVKLQSLNDLVNSLHKKGDEAESSQSTRLILKASRRSKRHIESTNEPLQAETETTPPDDQTIVSSGNNLACPEPQTENNCDAPARRTETPVEPSVLQQTGESLKGRDRSESGVALTGDELNECGAVDGKQESKGLTEAIRNPSQMRRPVSRKGREGRARGAARRGAGQHEHARQVPEPGPPGNTESVSQVQSLWRSQWTGKTFPSSRSIIRVSGEGSNLVFDCKDADLSGQSIQLNVADLEGNMGNECEKEVAHSRQAPRDACLGPPISAGSLSDDFEEQKQHTTRPPLTEVAHPQGLRTAVTKAAKTRDTTRFRAPFSFRGRKPTIIAAPEPNVATFECVVCTDYLSPPVRQCLTGHGLCPACLKGAELCPICRRAVPAEPNKGLDSLVRTVLFPCKNLSAGCKESYWIEDRARHEARCPYRPRPCPYASRSQVMCGWSGLRTMIRGHMKRAHGHHGTVYAYRTFFPLEDFNLAAWANRTYHVEIVFVEHEIFELHKVFDKRNTCLWGLLRHILARDATAQFSYSIRFQPANMRPNVTFRNDAVSGSEDLDRAFAQGKRFNLHLDCFTQTPLDIFSVQLKVQPVDRNKWP